MAALSRASFAGVLLAGASMAAPAVAADYERPSAESAVAAGALAGPPVAPVWEPQIAPGSALAPAPDARQEWTLLTGWKKIPVRGGGTPPQALPQVLPDPWPREPGYEPAWPRERSYDRAWYVSCVDLPPADGARLCLRFDAVAFQCEVFVNGHDVGGHIGGFTPFEFDLTAFARPGPNAIALFVRDQTAVVSKEKETAVSQLGVTLPDGSTSPNGLNALAGIRGGVYLERRPPTQIEHVLIHTSTRKNQIEVKTWLRSPAAAAGAVVTAAVYDWVERVVPNALGDAAGRTSALGTTRSTPVLVFPAATVPAGAETVETVLPWAEAQRWSPEHPHLYVLRTTVRSAGRSETVDTRFGFREFWIEGKQFMLNGSPIRLIGSSLSDDFNLALTPDVARRYSLGAFAFLKRELNYRAIRLHASIYPPEVAEAADEAGILLIDQSGFWSTMGPYYNHGADELLKNTRREFGEWFWRDANRPSVVIWDVENEMLRDSRGSARERWVLALDGFIQGLDPARVVEHSGAAWYSPTQEDIHVHMQEQYHAVLQDWAARGGAPLVMGEFWVGGRGGERRLTDSREFTDAFDWHQDESRLYREKILEMRNFGASGVMPFYLDHEILGRTNEGLRRSYDPKADPIFRWTYPGLRDLGAEALAPAIAFAWPRGASVVVGRSFAKDIVVCNDREEAASFTVVCDYGGQHCEWTVTLGPAAQDRRTVSFDRAESADLVVALSDAAGAQLGEDRLAIHAIAAERMEAPVLARRLIVMPPPTAETASALQELGLRFETASELPRDATHALLLVPPRAAPDALGRDGTAVRRFLSAGGRLLVLDQAQAPEWLPLALPFWPSAKKSGPEFTLLGWPPSTRDLIFSREVPLYASGHPAFAGMTGADFAWWNPVDGRVADDAFVRPGAIGTDAGAPYRVLAGATRRETAALIEGSFGAGTAIFCQAQVIAQRASPAARALLLNLLRYLDGPAWHETEQRVGLAGKISAAMISRLTGLPAGDFVMAESSKRVGDNALHLVLAGDGAAPKLLDDLARGGSTVLVLSQSTAGRIPGYAVEAFKGRFVAGTRGGAVDDPLFWGISTASFLPLNNTPARATLAKYPAAARVLLGGLEGSAVFPRDNVPGGPAAHALETFAGAAPVAVAESRGAGRLVVTTLEPWNQAVESHRQLLKTLLANAGIALPAEGERPAVVAVKSTVPPRLDGRLDDWTNDMEDRNVSPFTHAEPIVISSRDAVAEGAKAAGDLDFSAILYLLHDAGHLYLAGIIFSSLPAQVTVSLGGHRLIFDPANHAAAVDGRPLAPADFAVGRATAREVADTRLLSLARFNAQIGSTEAAADASGRTFEAEIPWADLGLTAAPAQFPASFELSRSDGVRLERPGAAGGGEPLVLRIEP